MEIYKDTEKQTAMLVCNASELAKIEHAVYSKIDYWYKKANEETEIWRADVDQDIARKLIEIDETISSILDESEAGNPKIK